MATTHNRAVANYLLQYVFYNIFGCLLCLTLKDSTVVPTLSANLVKNDILIAIPLNAPL